MFLFLASKATTVAAIMVMTSTEAVVTRAKVSRIAIVSPITGIVVVKVAEASWPSTEPIACEIKSAPIISQVHIFLSKIWSHTKRFTGKTANSCTKSRTYALSNVLRLRRSTGKMTTQNRQHQEQYN